MPRLSDADKAELKKLNEEEANLTTAFISKLLAATKKPAPMSPRTRRRWHGLSTMRELAAAADAAKSRKVEGYVLPLQNTTQQPDLQILTNRDTRKALFDDSWTRAERGGANDTRATIARLAQLRAQKAKLLGFPNYAAWKLTDQMAKTPEAALKFMDALVPASTAKAEGEGKDIQALIDAQKGGFKLEPWDWNFYAEQVRKAKYDLDESQIKPYFELNNVLHNGVFYAATSSTASPSSSAPTFPSTTPTCRSTKSSTPTASRWRSGTATTSSATTRTAARGWTFRRPVQAAGHAAGGLQRRQLRQARGGRAGAAHLLPT